jgi:hypothetical protein
MDMEKAEVIRTIREELRALNLGNLFEILSREHNLLNGTHKENIGKSVNYDDILNKPSDITKIVWLSTSIDKQGSLTVDSAWHDLYLRGDTSEDAKGVFIMAETQRSGDGDQYLLTKKKGASTSEQGIRLSVSGITGTTINRGPIVQALNERQVLEYDVLSGITVNLFRIVGYWE